MLTGVYTESSKDDVPILIAYTYQIALQIALQFLSVSSVVLGKVLPLMKIWSNSDLYPRRIEMQQALLDW
jgi:hypothetical protein